MGCTEDNCTSWTVLNLITLVEEEKLGDDKDSHQISVQIKDNEDCHTINTLIKEGFHLDHFTTINAFYYLVWILQVSLCINH